MLTRAKPSFSVFLAMLLLLLCETSAQAQFNPIQEGYVRFKASSAVIKMPSGAIGLFFDTTDCSTCRLNLPSWRFLGNLKIDSVMLSSGTTALVSEGQVSGFQIISDSLIERLELINPSKIIRRVPQAIPGDTLLWDSIRMQWHAIPDISEHYLVDLRNILVTDSAISILSDLQSITNLGPLYQPLEDGIDQSLVTPWTPNDDFFIGQWGLGDKVRDSGGINVELAWGLLDTLHLGEVQVAIIDRGVDTSHIDLVNKFLCGCGEPGFPGSHGTQMAGIISAETNNDSGMAGVAPHSTFVPYDAVVGDTINGYLGFAADIFQACADGAAVMNMSFSFPGPDTAILDAIRIANANAVTFVTTSGDFSTPGHPSAPFVSYPSAWDDSLTISVGAHDKLGKVASFSNWSCDTCVGGPFPDQVDVVAPGVSIWTTKKGGGMVLTDGTSPAAPVVAGMVALAKGYQWDLKPERIEEFLELSANRYNLDGLDSLDLSLKYGAGRVDAFQFIATVIAYADNYEVTTLTSDSVPCLIITSAALQSSFQSLADKRIAQGTFTEIKTVESIISAVTGYPGNDTQEKVRNCIKDYFDNHNLEWVILGGDETVVPFRYVYNDLRGPGIQSISDYYYSCLDGNWNFDSDILSGSDTLYGQVGDSVDLSPEVAVGRILVSTSQQVTDYLSKLELYESPASTDWITKSLVIGSQMYSTGDGRLFSESVISGFPQNFSITKMYDDGTGTVSSTREEYFTQMNSGKGIVLLHGLAQNSTNFFLKRETTPYELIYTEDIDTLSNDSMPSVVFSATCWNQKLDSLNIAESYMQRPVGGAVAYIGPTLNDFSFTSHDLRKEFFGQLFGSGPKEIGSLLNLGKEAIAGYATVEGGYRHSVFGYSLAGDPQMRIWTETPKVAIHDQLSTMVAGFSIVDTILDSTTGLPVEGAKVCLMKAPDYYEIKFTDANGVAVFWPNFTQTGTATFTATGENYVSSQSSLSVNQCSVLGDASNDCGFNIADVTFLVTMIFESGPLPAIPNNADMDRSCSVNIADVTYGVARIFSGGPAPLLGCVDSLPGFPKSIAGAGNYDLTTPDDYEISTEVEVSSSRSSDKFLAVNLNSTHRIHGLSLIIRLSDTSRASIRNLSNVPMHWSQRGNYVKVGLVDAYAREMLEPGSGTVLEISNGAEIVKVLATEILSDGTVNKMRPSEVLQVDDGLGGVSGFSFDQNYPNPFNPETNFSFSLPIRTHVKIEIYNLLGQRVSTLVDEDYGPGRHSVKWDSTNEQGKTVASGVYFAKFAAGEFTAKRKMVILK